MGVAKNQGVCLLPAVFSARVAELVDAHDSGSCVLTDVEVRFLSRAPSKKIVTILVKVGICFFSVLSVSSSLGFSFF